MSIGYSVPALGCSAAIALAKGCLRARGCNFGAAGPDRYSSAGAPRAGFFSAGCWAAGADLPAVWLLVVSKAAGATIYAEAATAKKRLVWYLAGIIEVNSSSGC